MAKQNTCDCDPLLDALKKLKALKKQYDELANTVARATVEIREDGLVSLVVRPEDVELLVHIHNNHPPF